MAAPIKTRVDKAAMQRPKGTAFVPIPVVRSQVLFVADSAEGALRGLAEWWNTTPLGGEAVSDEFKFVADDHEFVVTVTPLPPTLVDEPGEDFRDRTEVG